MTTASGEDLVPSSALPLAYYLCAYASFGSALTILALDPSLPGASFYQPRMVALVHLLTLGWLTGSILGSLYIVGPLALRVPMRVEKADWVAFTAFATGASGMVSHFWINSYDGMAWSAVLVIGAVTWVVASVVGGLQGAAVPFAVRLHVVLALVNILAGAAFGIVIGLNHSRGFLSISPLAAMFAHAHLAAVGWVTMLVVGLSYRLIPMMLPAQMPTGAPPVISAILLEFGLIILTIQLVIESSLIWIGALIIVAGVVSFIMQVRQMVMRRLPRPPALPARDWSTWQTHAAMAWLAVTVGVGLVLSAGVTAELTLPLMWMYGAAGLVGFLAQMVVGMQGRLVPLYAWYRVFAKTGMVPQRAANALPSAAFARPIFLCWAAGTPLLTWGLPFLDLFAIRSGAIFLLTGLAVGFAYVVFMLRQARGA